MNAVIMAGGFGTRLRPITCNIPKPMVPVANIPMMEHIVTLLKKHDLKKICSILYFQPEQITRYFGDGSEFGVEMDYVMATADFGTAGSVKNAEEKLKGKPFIIISGDVLTDFDLTRALEFHRQKKAMATMVLTRVTNPLEYGVVITDEEGKIVRFLEKPSWGEVFSDTINTGIYILEPEIFAHIPAQAEFDFSKNLFPLMVKEGLPLFGYIAEGYWKDIGDINEYRLAHKNVLDGTVQVDIPGNRLNVIGRDVWVGSNSRLGKKVKFKGGVIIGSNCEIEDDVELHNVIVGDGCVIKSGAVITESILWDRVYIGAKTRIDEAIIAYDSRIRDGATLERDTVISEECSIGEGATVRANVKIWPRKMVEDGSTVYTSIVWSEKWTKNLFSNFCITGLANLEITPELASKVGAAFGSTLPKGVFINTSRDSHNISRMLNRSVICGLLSSGVNVTDLRVMPAPVARYKIGSFGKSGGIHVNVSPDDPNQIQILVFDGEGRDLAPGQQKPIERLFNREDFRRVPSPEIGDITFPARLGEHYRDDLLHKLDLETIRRRKLKVVIDFAFSGASTILAGVLGKLKCEVISLNAYQDDSLAGRSAAENRHAIDTVGSIVKSVGADLGLILDAGAERIEIIDNQGHVIQGQKKLMVWMALFLNMKPGSHIAVPVSATHAMEELAKKQGGEIIRTKTNPRALMNAALSNKVHFCLDTQGGCIFPEFQPTFDGIMAAAKFIEFVASHQDPLSKILEGLPDVHLLHKEIPCPWEGKGRVMRQAMEFAKDKETILIDGVKLILEKNSWAMILPDPDKPFVALTVEAETAKRSQEILKDLTKRIDDWKEADS